MRGFWARPPLWVTAFFGAAMVLLLASMLTMREGLRFSSRALDPGEKQLVEQALDLWESVEVEPELQRPLRRLLADGQVRCMDEATFQRPQERATRGYTDERGRILLNPRICLGAWTFLGKAHPSDLVRLSSTLVHEAQHRQNRATEVMACEAELHFVRAAWMRTAGTEMGREFRLWSRELLAHRPGE